MRKTVEGKGKREDGGRKGVEGMKVGRRKEYLEVVFVLYLLQWLLISKLHLGTLIQDN